jgi:hypothetical protein
VKLTLTLTGVAPLIVQSDRLVNPLDPITRQHKAITKKGSKMTDADHEEKGRLEFYGSLYYDPTAGPYIPGDNIQASLRTGGSFVGRLGKAVERAVVVTQDVNPIEYRGPRTTNELWGAPDFRLVRSVVMQRARTMRTRPIFRMRRVATTLELATDLMNLDDFVRVAEAAGSMAGIGTWRPRYGRYDVEVKQS